MNILNKILNKFYSVQKQSHNILKSIHISILSDYKKLSHPQLSEYNIKYLWGPNSFLAHLIHTNHNVLKDFQKLESGEFNVLHKKINLKDDFNWNEDFFSGKKYPDIPYLRIKTEVDKKSDIIVPWEFSRLQFIPTLIGMHLKAQDEGAFNLAKKIIDNWIKNNRFKFGVNWMCPMDVGIRSINLALGIFFFYNLFDDDTKEFYLQVLWAHALYILENESFQSNSVKKHNHYLISTISLLILLLCFYGEDTEVYLMNVLDDLKEEIIHQFHEDGCNFESANHYHQLSLEAVLLGISFLELFNSINKLDYVDRFLNDSNIQTRIDKAVIFVSDYSQVFKSSPQFGDSSDGRIILYKDYFDWDPRDHSFISDLYSLTKSKLERIYKNNFKYYSSGYGMFLNSVYGLIVNASMIDKFVSGHNHCDKGSFVLQSNGIQLFVDSGTFCYTSDLVMRNKFRQTNAHNTVLIDKKEQASFTSGAFSRLNKINFKLLESSNGFIYQQEDYNSVLEIKKINREFICDETSLIIVDSIEGKGKHLIEIILNIAPNVHVSIVEKKIIFYKEGISICSLVPDENCSIFVEDSIYSPGYRRLSKSKKIIISQSNQLPTKLKNTFYFKKI